VGVEEEEVKIHEGKFSCIFHFSHIIFTTTIRLAKFIRSHFLKGDIFMNETHYSKVSNLFLSSLFM
jgi:hypothetical protein